MTTLRLLCALLVFLLGAPAARAATTVTVVSYNIQACIGELPRPEPRDPAGTLGRMADLLRAEGADIVLLQEVDNGTSRSRRIDQAAMLAERLGFQHVFGAAIELQGGHFGTAILSRWPLTTSETVLLHKPDYSMTNPEYPDYYSEQRVALMAEVDAPGGPLTVLCTHLGLTPDQRKLQAEEIAALVKAAKGPVIVGGDLNAEPGAPELTALFAPMTDAWEASAAGGPGHTFRSDNPTKRIDYILVRGCRTDSAEVLAPTLSDHLALKAVISPER